jgi:hypothetical protein
MMPTEPLILRDAGPPGLIVVVRLGTRTLVDEYLAQRCEATFARWGVHGFSVLEVPDRTNWTLLARLRPEVTTRPTLFAAEGRNLAEAGFPLLPTMAHPHWTVAVAEPTPVQFQRVREIFRGPTDNPAFRIGT